MPREKKPRIPPERLERARNLRKESSIPERVLWGMLRNKRLAGIKFRRQVPLGPYTVDFYCPHAKLVIELDGTSHDGHGTQDDKRDEVLNEIGLEVLRITNSDLATVPDGVKQAIRNAVMRRLKTDPPPNPLPPGREGEPEDAKTTQQLESNPSTQPQTNQQSQQ